MVLALKLAHILSLGVLHLHPAEPQRWRELSEAVLVFSSVLLCFSSNRNFFFIQIPEYHNVCVLFDKFSQRGFANLHVLHTQYFWNKKKCSVPYFSCIFSPYPENKGAKLLSTSLCNCALSIYLDNLYYCFWDIWIFINADEEFTAVSWTQTFITCRII